MNLETTKITDIVSEILNSAVGSAIRSAITEVKKDLEDRSAVIWSEKPFISASTEVEADNNGNGSPDIIGLFCSFFEDDCDARFVPFERIIEIEMHVPTESEIKERVAIWKKFACMMEKAAEEEIKARRLDTLDKA